MNKIKVIGSLKILLLLGILLWAGNASAQSYITIPAIPGRSLCDEDFPVNANAEDKTIPLIYFSSNTAVATISTTGIIHIVGIGTTSIQAIQPGATTASVTFDVTVPQPPKVTIAVDQPTVCIGAPVTFTATISDPGSTPTYQWKLNGTNAGTNSATFTTATLTPTDEVYCVVTIAKCSLTGTSNTITGIIANPYLNTSVAITAFPAGTICAGGNVTFTATAVNGSPSPAYQWQVNGVNVGGNAATFSTTALANGDKVTCNLTVNGAGCFTPNTSVSNAINMSVSAAVGPPSVVTIVASANNVKSGTPVTFTATSTLAASSYQWQVNGVNVGTNSAVFTSALLKNGDIVTCVVLTGGACIAPATSQAIVMTMLAPPNLHIVNTFTPNGDGVNDVWDIPDLSYYPDCLMTIYNRYGTTVYQSKGYAKAWDGTHNGRQLPIGAYYYIIDPNNGTITTRYSGCITIIR